MMQKKGKIKKKYVKLIIKLFHKLMRISTFNKIK